MSDPTFPIHLVIIKNTISIPKKTRIKTFVQPLLDLQLLDEMFFFMIDYESQCRANNG